MKISLASLCAVLFLPLPIIFSSCNTDNNKAGGNKTGSIKPAKKDSAKNKKQEPVEKPAIINIVDTVAPKRIVLYMKDSVNAMERIGTKLGMIYGVKLAEIIKKSGLKITGAPMAWYKKQKAPYFFEAGIPVNKKPAKLPKNIFVREMKTDSVMMAHFYGPYNILSQGYNAIKERIKDEKKSVTGAPYEIYIDDPMDKNGKPADPYKVRTDIIFPRK